MNRKSNRLGFTSGYVRANEFVLGPGGLEEHKLASDRVNKEQQKADLDIRLKALDAWRQDREEQRAARTSLQGSSTRMYT